MNLFPGEVRVYFASLEHVTHTPNAVEWTTYNLILSHLAIVATSSYTVPSRKTLGISVRRLPACQDSQDAGREWIFTGKGRRCDLHAIAADIPTGSLTQSTQGTNKPGERKEGNCNKASQILTFNPAFFLTLSLGPRLPRERVNVTSHVARILI